MPTLVSHRIDAYATSHFTQINTGLFSYILKKIHKIEDTATDHINEALLPSLVRQSW